MRWHDLGVALALLLVIEGIFPFLNPAGIRRALEMLANLSDQQIRFFGLTSMLLGLVLLYVVDA